MVKSLLASPGCCVKYVTISKVLLIVPECDYFTFNATCEFREEYSFCIHMRKISNLSVLCDNPPIWPNGFFVGFLNGHMLDFYAGGKGRIIAKSNVTIEDIFDAEFYDEIVKRRKANEISV